MGVPAKDLEDLHDLAIMVERRDEEIISLKELKERLARDDSYNLYLKGSVLGLWSDTNGYGKRVLLGCI